MTEDEKKLIQIALEFLEDVADDVDDLAGELDQLSCNLEDIRVALSAGLLVADKTEEPTAIA